MSADSGIITGHPFSAIKFSRTVLIGAHGAAAIVAERPDIRIARDVHGRIAIVDDALPQSCDPPEPWNLRHTEARSRCVSWYLMIFDPNLGILWHWNESEKNDHQCVQVDLLSGQIADAKRATSAVPVVNIEQPRPTVSTQELGEQDIEGVRATGVRTITLHKDAVGVATVTIHEVWTSTELGLVLKVIDGDPAGEEVISGLDNISLTPSPQLFEPPNGRKLRHYTDGKFVGHALPRLENWLVR